MRKTNALPVTKGKSQPSTTTRGVSGRAKKAARAAHRVRSLVMPEPGVRRGSGQPWGLPVSWLLGVSVPWLRGVPLPWWWRGLPLPWCRGELDPHANAAGPTEIKIRARAGPERRWDMGVSPGGRHIIKKL